MLTESLVIDLTERAEHLRGSAFELARLQAARAALGDHASDAVSGLTADLDARIGELGGGDVSDELARVDAALRALRA